MSRLSVFFLGVAAGAMLGEVVLSGGEAPEPTETEVQKSVEKSAENPGIRFCDYRLEFSEDGYERFKMYRRKLQGERLGEDVTERDAFKQMVDDVLWSEELKAEYKKIKGDDADADEDKESE